MGAGRRNSDGLGFRTLFDQSSRMVKLLRAVLLLMVAVAIAGYFLGGGTAKDNSLFGPTVAAWAKAIFAAAAVFAAAWLQERFITR